MDKLNSMSGSFKWLTSSDTKDAKHRRPVGLYNQLIEVIYDRVTTTIYDYDKRGTVSGWLKSPTIVTT